MIDVEMLANGNVKVTIPMSFRNCSGRKRIVTPDDEQNFSDPLITNLARAYRWQSLIDAGQFANVHELAAATGKDQAYVARVLRMTLLAPEIVHAVLTGALPDGIGVEDLQQSMPILWSEQKKLLNME